MIQGRIGRRAMLGGGLGLAAAAALPFSAAARATDYVPMKLPPPIGRDERIRRLAGARALMQRHRTGRSWSSCASLEYFTGIHGRGSERLTAVVIPVDGDPIIVTPFFEKPFRSRRA